MATNQARIITNTEIELLSFLRQNIIRKLLEEASVQQRDKRDPLVIAAVVAYFNLGPTPHSLFHNLVHQLAHSFRGVFFQNGGNLAVSDKVTSKKRWHPSVFLSENVSDIWKIISVFPKYQWFLFVTGKNTSKYLTYQ